jgi:glycosyltransferase involved in cell wall biosynthesis
VLVDGLVGACVPEVVDVAARRHTVVALVHMPLADERGLDREVASALRDAERLVLRRVAGTISTSHHIRHRLCSEYNLPYLTTTAALPGTDPAPLATGSTTGSRLLCVGALTETKNQLLLVSALARLAQLPWTLRLVGPERVPQYAAAVRDAIARAGLSGRITFTGPLAGAALAREYADADLLLLPSVSETFGLVIGEALACGVPVLATSVGGTPEALGTTSLGLPGRLLDPDAPADWTAAVQDWLTDPALRAQLRAAARERRGTLTGWEVTAGAVAQALDRARTPVAISTLDECTALAGATAAALRTLDPRDATGRSAVARRLREAGIVPELAYDRIPRSAGVREGRSLPPATDPQAYLEYVLATLLRRLEAAPGYGDDLLHTYADSLEGSAAARP